MRDEPVALVLSTLIKAMQIARALQEAMWTGEVSNRDEDGSRIEILGVDANGNMNRLA